MLAWLAVVAQLWMGQVGAVHVAQLLATGTPWGDICSVQDASRGDRKGDTGRSSHLRDALSCPVCNAGASGSAPLLTSAALPIDRANAPAALPLASAAPVRGEDPAALRPPSQAPPVRA